MAHARSQACCTPGVQQHGSGEPRACCTQSPVLSRSDAALASEPMHLLSVWYPHGNALWLISRGHVLGLPPANSPCFMVRDGRWVTGSDLSDESSFAPAFCVMYDWRLARGWGA